MRRSCLESIAFGVCVLVLADLTLGAEAKTGSGSKGMADAGSPDVNTIGLGGAPVGCTFGGVFETSATADNYGYHTCLANGIYDQGYTTAYSTSGGVPKVTIYAGSFPNNGEPDGICYEEHDNDIGYIALRRSGGALGKIRKFTSTSEPQFHGSPSGQPSGAMVSIEINTSSMQDTIIVSTDTNPPLSLQDLNKALFDRLHLFGPAEDNDYIYIPEVWQLGIRSSDTGVINMEIAIEPIGTTQPTYCHPPN